MYYVVAIKKPIQWTIDHDVLARQLAAVRPDVTIASIDGPDELYASWWALPDENGALEGWVERSGVFIALHGSFKSCTAFAAWFRERVPEQVALTFCDGDYSECADVLPGMSAEELAKTMHPVKPAT